MCSAQSRWERRIEEERREEECRYFPSRGFVELMFTIPLAAIFCIKRGSSRRRLWQINGDGGK